MSTNWKLSENSPDPVVRSFATTASLRSQWQRIRNEAQAGAHVDGLEEFWSTHLTSRRMAATLHSSRSDIFQLLLAVLWLYTREAWLSHLLDALSSALSIGGASHMSLVGSAQSDGTPGAVPMGLPPALESLAPLVASLSPFMQMLQSALIWFDEAGRRHTAMTYRPLLLPMRSLQRLIERYNKTNEDSCKQEGQSLTEGTWISLGTGALFSAMSSRQDAIKRMTRMRCSVLLVLKPDEHDPCYPKQMSLSSGVADDILFPLGALYRVTRMTRKDIDLDNPQTGDGGGRWPVVILEVSAACRHVEALELLEQRGELKPGALESHMQMWSNGAPAGTFHERLLIAGEALLRAPARGAGGRVDAASGMFQNASKLSEELGDVSAMAKAILLLARCRIVEGLATPAELVPDGKRALQALEEEYGQNHPATSTAKRAWQDLGVNV